MALVFARRLAIPLLAIAFLTVALTAPSPAPPFLMPPTTLFLIAIIGIALIVFTVPSAIPWLRRSRSLVPVLPSRHPSRHRDRTNAAIAMAAGAGVRRLDEPSRHTADDALDFARMDDDGGWQMARPPA
jgi:hypothetical protein